MPSFPYYLQTAFIAIIISASLCVSCDGTVPAKGGGAGPVKEYLLPEDQKRSFKTISDFWRENVYPECLRKFRLRMSCDGCGYIYMTVVIRIDDRGRLSDYEKTGENVCGRAASQGLERCFMEYLETITFPENLRGAVIEVRLGTGLKC